MMQNLVLSVGAFIRKQICVRGYAMSVQQLISLISYLYVCVYVPQTPLLFFYNGASYKYLLSRLVF